MIEFAITEEDYIAAVTFAYSRKRGLLWLQIANSVIFLAMGTFFSFSAAAPQGLQPIGMLCFVVVGLLWLLYIFSAWILMPWRARRRFGESKMLHGSRNASWNSEAVTVKTQYGTNTIPWTAFSEYAENEGVILIYTSPRLSMFIPKRALSDVQTGELRTAFHAARAVGQISSAGA